MTPPAFAAERRRQLHGNRSAPAAGAPFSNRSISPVRRALSSKPPAAVAAVDRCDKRTDGRTHDRFVDYGGVKKCSD